MFQSRSALVELPTKKVFWGVKTSNSVVRFGRVKMNLRSKKKMFQSNKLGSFNIYLYNVGKLEMFCLTIPTMLKHFLFTKQKLGFEKS